MDNNGLINSKEEYKLEYRKFLKKIKKIRSYEDFEKMMADAEKIGLFAKEDIPEMKNKIALELSNAMDNKLKWIGQKIRNGLLKDLRTLKEKYS